MAWVSSPDVPQIALIYEAIIGFPINICQNNVFIQTKAFFIYSYKRALNFQQRIACHQKHSINGRNLWRYSTRGWWWKTKVHFNPSKSWVPPLAWYWYCMYISLKASSPNIKLCIFTHESTISCFYHPVLYLIDCFQTNIFYFYCTV